MLLVHPASTLLPLDEGGIRKSKPGESELRRSMIRVKLHRVSEVREKGSGDYAPSGVQSERGRGQIHDYL